jgi:hypothetical protein
MKLGLGLLTRFEQIMLEEVQTLSLKTTSTLDLVAVQARKVPVGQHRNYPKMTVQSPSFQHKKVPPSTATANAAGCCVIKVPDIQPSIVGPASGLTAPLIAFELDFQNVLKTPLRLDKPIFCEEIENEEDSGYLECKDLEELAFRVALEEEGDIFLN